MRDIFLKCVAIGFVLFLELLFHGFQIPTSWLAIPLQNQSYANLAVIYINASIYWSWNDALELLRWIFDRWNDIKDPIKKLGVLFVSVLLTMNLLSFLKQRALENRHSVYCPIDNLPARPIRGTINRYKCRKGHQFTDDLGHHW